MNTPPGAQRPQAIGSALLQTPSSATASAANSVPQAAYTPSLGDTFIQPSENSGGDFPNGFATPGSADRPFIHSGSIAQEAAQDHV